MQSFIFTGNLTKDVELKQTPNGKEVCTLSVAVNRPHSEETDFFNVEVWGKQAENCNKFLKKGSKVGIIGYIKIRAYDGNDGVKRYVTEVVAEQVEFLSPKKADNEEANPVKKFQKELQEFEDDNVPF